MKRKCTKCKKEKELNEENFYKRLMYTGGYTPNCKECLIENGKKNNRKYAERDNWTKLFLG